MGIVEVNWATWAIMTLVRREIRPLRLTAVQETGPFVSLAAIDHLGHAICPHPVAKEVTGTIRTASYLDHTINRWVKDSLRPKRKRTPDPESKPDQKITLCRNTPICISTMQKLEASKSKDDRIGALPKCASEQFYEGINC